MGADLKYPITITLGRGQNTNNLEDSTSVNSGTTAATEQAGSQAAQQPSLFLIMPDGEGNMNGTSPNNKESIFQSPMTRDASSLLGAQSMGSSQGFLAIPIMTGSPMGGMGGGFPGMGGMAGGFPGMDGGFSGMGDMSGGFPGMDGDFSGMGDMSGGFPGMGGGFPGMGGMGGGFPGMDGGFSGMGGMGAQSGILVLSPVNGQMNGIPGNGQGMPTNEAMNNGNASSPQIIINIGAQPDSPTTAEQPANETKKVPGRSLNLKS